VADDRVDIERKRVEKLLRVLAIAPAAAVALEVFVGASRKLSARAIARACLLRSARRSSTGSMCSRSFARACRASSRASLRLTSDAEPRPIHLLRPLSWKRSSHDRAPLLPTCKHSPRTPVLPLS
jgi:hypothetical protein